MADEPESLWAFGDPEPWRRGRFAIGLISALVLFGHAGAAAYRLSEGDIGQSLLIAVAGCVAAFIFFLVWIGQTWVRWLIAPVFALLGFCCVIWGISRSGMGLMFLFGIALLIIFSYLALAPSVYDFARRQREKISIIELVVISAAFFLLVVSVGSAYLAFHIYKHTLESEAVGFAQLTFHRVFINRDAHFLEDHASEGLKYARPQEFINYVEEQLGETRSVGPFAPKLRYALEDRKLQASGSVGTRALFEHGGAWVTIQISGAEGHWEVEHVGWTY